MAEARENITVIFEMDRPEARIVGSDFEITIPLDMDKLEILHLIDKIIMIRKERNLMNRNVISDILAGRGEV